MEAGIAVPPKNATVLRCSCGAHYRDYVDSREAHLTVFGHRPITPTQAAAEAGRTPVAVGDSDH